MATPEDLKNYPHTHDSFAGIDSDGCVFDTMRVKQHNHIQKTIIRHWHLEPVAELFRECADFVNLYSQTRGVNRFHALLLNFETLNSRPEARTAGIPLPKTEALRRYCESGLALGNPTLEAEARRTGSEELADILTWSHEANADLAAHYSPVAPFPWAVKALELMQGTSDTMVVSQTPEASLLREWNHHALAGYVKLIGGQELGSKVNQLRGATQGFYAPGRAILIGDAPADYRAANEAGTLFYPIFPGDEDASWRRFCEEAYPRFLAGTYAGAYADDLAGRFMAALPATPPWIT